MVTPFARPFVVDDWFLFQLKRLRRYVYVNTTSAESRSGRSAVRRSTWTRCSANCAGRGERNASFTRVGEPVVIIGREQSVPAAR